MLQSLKEIIDSPLSAYTGSKETLAIVSEQIRAKYGPTELKNYDPYHNTRSFHSWLKLGFRVKKGEKAIKSITFVEVKDNNGKVIKKIKRPCFLFYYRQVEKINPNKD